jgi:hypothetical protein
VERQDADGAAPFRELSTVRGGTVQIGASGSGRALAAGEELRLRDARGILASVRTADSGVVVTFRGRVTGARNGLGDAAPDLMPTRLAEMPPGRATLLLGAVAALAGGLAYAAPLTRRHPPPRTPT